MSCLSGSRTLVEPPRLTTTTTTPKKPMRRKPRRSITVGADPATSKLLVRAPSFVAGRADVTRICSHTDAHGHGNLHKHMVSCIICQATCISLGTTSGTVALPSMRDLLLSIDAAWNALWI